MEKDVVERLQEYVSACETTANGGSKHCQDCRDAIAEIGDLRRQLLDDLTSILGKVKKTEDVMREADERLTRAGL